MRRRKRHDRNSDRYAIYKLESARNFVSFFIRRQPYVEMLDVVAASIVMIVACSDLSHPDNREWISI